MKYIIIAAVIIALGTVLILVGGRSANAPTEEPVACTAEAKLCPDGSTVGRTGPNCEFAPCPEVNEAPEVPADIQSHIDSKADLIVVENPSTNAPVGSPLTITGKARGYWYFEASFPIVVVDWDGRIIGEGYATAQDDWMTEEFVPFEGTIEFDLPEDTPYKRGAIIFQKSNASGLPEHDDALEIPVHFE